MPLRPFQIAPLGRVIAASWQYNETLFSIQQQAAPAPIIPGGFEVGADSIKFATGNLQVAGQTSVLRQSTTGLGNVLRATNAFFIARIYIDFDRMNRGDRFMLLGNGVDGDQPGNMAIRFIPDAANGAFGTRRGKFEFVTRLNGGVAQARVSTASVPKVSGWYDLVLYRNGSNVITFDVRRLTDGTKAADGAASALTNADFGIGTFTESAFYIGDAVDVSSQPTTSTARGSDANVNVGWEGAIAFVGWGVAANSDSDWQAIALGADPLTRLGASNFTYFRRFSMNPSGAVQGLGPVAGTSDTSAAATVIGTFLPGGTPGRQTTSDWITLDPVPDYQVYGIVPGTDIATIPVSGSCGGVPYSGVFTASKQLYIDDRREVRFLSGAIQARYITEGGTPLTAWQTVATTSATGITEGRTFTDNSRSTVGVDVMPNGQSQMTIFCEGTSLNNTLPGPSCSMVRWETGVLEPTAQAFQTRPEVGNLRTSDGVAELARTVQARYQAAVRIILNAVPGTGISNLLDDWIRGSHNTLNLLAYAGGNLTIDLYNWHSADVAQGANFGTNVLGAAYLGTGPLATANKLPDIRAATARIVIAVASRETTTSAGPFTTDQSTGVGLVRQSARAWAAANGAYIAPEQIDIRLDTGQGPHQLPSSVRGNMRMGIRMGEGILRALGVSTLVDPTIGSPQFNSGKASFRLTVTLPNAGSALRVDNTATYGSNVQGFEISTDGGSTWSRNGFTATFSGTTVTLTKSSGDWTGVTAGNMRVRYAWGGPFSYGTSLESSEEFRGLLYDGVSVLEGGLGLPVSPLASTVVAEP